MGDFFVHFTNITYNKLVVCGEKGEGKPQWIMDNGCKTMNFKYFSLSLFENRQSAEQKVERDHRDKNGPQTMTCLLAGGNKIAIIIRNFKNLPHCLSLHLPFPSALLLLPHSWLLLFRIKVLLYILSTFNLILLSLSRDEKYTLTQAAASWHFK